MMDINTYHLSLAEKTSRELQSLYLVFFILDI